jgi:transcriptional regulator with XRE-family HTH domain
MPIRRRKQSQFGARLFLFRRQAHLSREELASRSGTSVHSIQSWEQGRAANPTLRVVFGLARSLGATVIALLEGVEADFESFDEPSVHHKVDNRPSRWAHL